MGREAKIKKARETARVMLPAVDYWKLRATIRDVEAIQKDAMEAAQRFGRSIHEAQQKASALLVELGKAHGFDATKVYGWDDATCELIEQSK